MEEYSYRGYSIEYNEFGNYEIDFDDCVMEFTTYEEATEWIDTYLDEHSTHAPKLHTYHIFFATEDYDRGYDEIVTAYSEDEAISKVRRLNPDLAYITDCYRFKD